MAEPQPTENLRSLVDSAQEAIAEASQKQSLQLPYAAPDRRPNPAVENFDKVRAALFALAGVLLLVTSLNTALDTSSSTQGGLLDTSPVLAFVWPAIAITMIASAGYSVLPHQLSSRRQRAITVYGLSAVALMACALTFTAGFLLWPGALLATLATGFGLYGMFQMNRHTARNHLERIATDLPVSFFTGFSLTFTLQLWFSAAGWNRPEHLLAISIVTVLATLLAAGFAQTERGRHALATGYGFGMFAAAYQAWRQESAPLWFAALLVFMAIIVFICAESRRFQISHAEHRNQRGLRAED
ncbi:hypothetical protein CQ017_09160 [Arthrobacter sp. MYb224]|uniref:hypothetical protein n=1 Tax=Micrococcaceae TaxID=1268 RepID=UPI000CFDDA51|nr:MULTISPECIES: hypothetical protein [unclassified Arthrobacter]PQZ98705.1 hypothetical protein CQ017_09160 [Arthrobacter sp. MYb224]PRA03039.1 hypothetical protein CQ019_11260 [Arthrobacter sp. MYb229]PRB49509.1 hypothetical protein CQ013_12740 [Arthrobacter sp. MYb216]